MAAMEEEEEGGKGYLELDGKEEEEELEVAFLLLLPLFCFAGWTQICQDTKRMIREMAHIGAYQTGAINSNVAFLLWPMSILRLARGISSRSSITNWNNLLPKIRSPQLEAGLPLFPPPQRERKKRRLKKEPKCYFDMKRREKGEKEKKTNPNWA